MRLSSKLAASVLATCLALLPAVASAQQMQAISIALSSSSLSASGARIADAMGLFGQRGLGPKFTVMNSSSDALAALISGSVNFAVAGTPELIVAHARGQTQQAAIATSSAGFPASLVLLKSVAAKLGVAPNGPVAERLKALDGLVIATPSAVTIGTVTVRRAAQSVGANIRWTYINQPAMAAALETGAVQGYLASSPYWVLPVTNGEGVLWLSGPKGDIPAEFAPAIASPIEALRDFAEANRTVVKRVAEVFDEFAKAVRERPADVKAAVASLYPDLDARTIDLLYDSESQIWTATQATSQIMANEIALEGERHSRVAVGTRRS